MKCIYFSEGITKFHKSSKEIISAIVIDEENRDPFKKGINDLFAQCFGEEYRLYPIYWDDIDGDNATAYLHVVRLFNINPNITLFSYIINNSNVEKKRATYIKMIYEIKELYKDEVKVFMPYSDKGKRNMKRLRNDLQDIDIDCIISQNPLEESRFYQVSQLFTEILMYFDNELEFFDNIDEPGKSQLVNYYLDMKKPKNKINSKRLS